MLICEKKSEDGDTMPDGGRNVRPGKISIDCAHFEVQVAVRKANPAGFSIREEAPLSHYNAVGEEREELCAVTLITRKFLDGEKVRGARTD